ncbi:MAG: 1-acyl-sn-glycerol-3-phosphate acyltransferase [Clostridia bacterium]|nr:1-acyl-sn-glycerol-3-phosphate acyltransferase [Clostridia bacterium]
MFDPKPTRYPFPEYTDRHYLVVKKNDGTVFDENYPFFDDSFPARAKRFLTRILLFILVFPVNRVRLGLVIRGKKNVKKNRDLLKGGVISCANHVHLWDYICVMEAVWPFKPDVLVWAPNIRGENGRMMRSVGGVPIPDAGHRATRAYGAAIRKYLASGGWLHLYPEGSMWEFYAPIRPFKNGVGYLAVQNGKPVLPMGFSYRKPGWIRKKVFRQQATFTLTVGEPVFPDPDLPKREREEDLVRRCHEAVCRLAGIEPEENLYPPLFDRTKRVDYYER